MKIIKRNNDTAGVAALIKTFPVTAIIGPRQCGKTFLAKRIKHSAYFDLENPRDFTRLANPQVTLEDIEGLIIIDEVQRNPALFPLIRYLVDNNKKQKYLLLGSASPELMKNSSESLAGRIGYYNLGGFSILDIKENEIEKLWIRGGFPLAFLSGNDTKSAVWRDNYILTFLERDIPQLGINIPSNTLRRFWTMISHYHGQTVNYSEAGMSFGISDMTVRRYIDILEKTFMVRMVQPWRVNIGKRLVKRPKIYLRDSGILHSLLSIENKTDLFSHNKLGASWEGFAFENVSRSIGKRSAELYFWSTHTGAEVDLFWQHKGKNWAIEFKYADAPGITRSMQVALKDLKLSHIWVIYPGKEDYKLSPQITVKALRNIRPAWEYKLIYNHNI